MSARLGFGEVKRLLAFVPRRSLLMAVSLVGAVSGLAQAGFVLSIGRISASLAKSDDTTIFGLSLVAAFAVALALLVLLLVTYLGFSSLAARLLGESTHQARQRALAQLLHASWERQSEERPGEFQEIVNGHVNRIGLGVNSVAQCVLAFVNMVVLLVVATVVSPGAALMVIIAAVPLFAVLRPIIALVSRYAAERGEAVVALGASVAETVSLGRDISVFGVDQAFTHKLDADIDDVTTPVIKGHFYRVATPFLFQVAVFVLVWLGLVATWQLDLANFEDLSITVLLFLRAMMHGRDLQRSLVVVADARPYVDEYEMRLERLVPATSRNGDVALGPIKTISLENSAYTYPTDTTPALGSVSLHASQGEAIGIVGPSGSGKSTLSEILLRLRRGQGNYLINGVPAQEVSAESWTDTVAYVPQRPTLLHASVTDNIRFHRTNISEDDITAAAQLAQVHDEILALPNGFDTVLSGLEGQLSGGQAQRVCIARALAGNPTLLVLDEPTSALDAAAEARIAEVLRTLKGQVTSFLITHRLSAAQHCDRIIHLDNGTIDRVVQAKES